MLHQSNNVPLFLPSSWLWPPQGKQPLRIRKLPEVKLWAAKASLQAARVCHLHDFLILRELNGVQRKRRGPVLDFALASSRWEWNNMLWLDDNDYPLL